MSAKMFGMVFDHYPGGGNELLLALKLADNADQDGGSIFPSVGTLAAKTRLSERTVQYQLKRMLEMGWLEKVREGFGGGRGGGFGRAREYRISPDWVRAYDGSLPLAERPVWTPRSAGTATEAIHKEMGAKTAPISQGCEASVQSNRAAQSPQSPAGCTNCQSESLQVRSVPVEQATARSSSRPKRGAEIAPISCDMARKGVQPRAEMGAIAVAEMGATAIAPYPPLTVIEPNTPQPPADAGGVQIGFEDFFAEYPRKEHEARARQQWAKLDPDHGLAAEIVAAVRAQVAGHQWQRLMREQRGHFIPLPGNWLRNERWLDVVEVSIAGSILSQWWLTLEGTQEKGRELGKPYSLKALGNAYTDDQLQAHNRRYREEIEALDAKTRRRA